jgi:hypothetical protein
MNEQRQRNTNDQQQQMGVQGGDGAGSESRLADTRAELANVYAAADAILDGIRLGDNERFLEQVRQSGGQ